MVNFLLLLEKNINYSKKDIDKGNTPPKIYKICSYIRETFCLSYTIRKNNVLYLYFQNEHALIKFDGQRLRFLGPDERSQALLLNKVLNKIHEKIDYNNKKWVRSTPGIFIQKFSNDFEFFEFFTSISSGINNIIIDTFQYQSNFFNVKKNFDSINHLDFFIISTYHVKDNNIKIIELFKELNSINFVSLSKIKSIENKVLYINYRKDQQGTL
ncbi:MAG: hypothetical protein ACFFE5_02190 [Candidatus Thorarchaeota archaeon]